LQNPATVDNRRITVARARPGFQVPGDASAAIASGAEVVLVDELAHATADRARQRWQDVGDVLGAGLDVVTTMNVAHLRSVRDYAARITGVGSVACVPDEFVRAGEVVLVDLPAEALRQRIASGAVYSAGLRRLLPAAAVEEVRKP
jgi:two-component system, OmpR family, sensor histidine kinase KdpD